MSFSKALSLISELIKEVEALPSGGAGPVIFSSSAAPVAIEPAGDTAWRPLVPPGHTSYTWGKSALGLAAGSPGAAFSSSAHQSKAVESKPVETSPPKQNQNQNQNKDNKQNQNKDNKQNQNKDNKQNQNKDNKQNQNKDNKQKQGDKKEEASEPKSDVPDFYQIDIRVGKITNAWVHTGADALYVEHIDLGENEPRQVISGLRKSIPLEKFIGSDVLVITNLKPVDMRGIMSYGMVLAASNKDKTVVELVQPPAGTPVGARVYLEGEENVAFDYVPATEIDGKKKGNVFAKVAEDLKTNAQKIVVYKDKPLRLLGGQLFAPTLADARVS